MRILIIEDEVTLSKTLAEGLKEYGYQNDVAESLTDGRYFLDIRNYDLVLLDWMLPDGNGIDLIPEIKEKRAKTAVIVLSARDDKESEIEALRLGADDYIKKPFDFDILLMRIEAKLRFGGSNIIEIEDLIINPEEEKIIYKGEIIELKSRASPSRSSPTWRCTKTRSSPKSSSLTPSGKSLNWSPPMSSKWPSTRSVKRWISL